METHSERLISPKEKLKEIYKDFLESCSSTTITLAKITNEADFFAEEPKDVQAIFQSLSEKVKKELPEIIAFKREQHFRSPIVKDGRPKQIYENENFRHYSPKLNAICYAECNQEDDLQKGTPFAGQNADLDSVESLINAMSPFIRSSEGKALLHESLNKISKLKQQFHDDFNNEKKIGAESIKIKTSRLLEAIKNYMGEGKIPPYIPLWMDLMTLVGKETPIDQGRLDPYLSTRDSKIIMAPTLVKKKLFKTEYLPDIGKSKTAEEDEWLNPLLPVCLAELLPKQIKNELQKHE